MAVEFSWDIVEGFASPHCALQASLIYRQDPRKSLITQRKPRTLTGWLGGLIFKGSVLVWLWKTPRPICASSSQPGLRAIRIACRSIGTAAGSLNFFYVYLIFCIQDFSLKFFRSRFISRQSGPERARSRVWVRSWRSAHSCRWMCSWGSNSMTAALQAGKQVNAKKSDSAVCSPVWWLMGNS